MKDELTEKVKRSKIDNTKIKDTLDKLVESANVKIKDKDLDNLFKNEK